MLRHASLWTGQPLRGFSASPAMLNLAREQLAPEQLPRTVPTRLVRGRRDGCLAACWPAFLGKESGRGDTGLSPPHPSWASVRQLSQTIRAVCAQRGSAGRLLAHHCETVPLGETRRTTSGVARLW
jgi:hypothetical protein